MPKPSLPCWYSTYWPGTKDCFQITWSPKSAVIAPNRSIANACILQLVLKSIKVTLHAKPILIWWKILFTTKVKYLDWLLWFLFSDGLSSAEHYKIWKTSMKKPKQWSPIQRKRFSLWMNWHISQVPGIILYFIFLCFKNYRYRIVNLLILYQFVHQWTYVYSRCSMVPATIIY